MLTLQNRLRPNEEEVAGKVMDGDAIIINLSNGIYYSMDKVRGAPVEDQRLDLTAVGLGSVRAGHDLSVGGGTPSVDYPGSNREMAASRSPSSHAAWPAAAASVHSIGADPAGLPR